MLQPCFFCEPMIIYILGSSLLLPRNIPKFCVKFNNSLQSWDANVERVVSQDEMNIINDKINILCGYIANVSFNLDPNIINEFKNDNNNSLSITVSRHSTFDYSKAVMNKWEDDEQIWANKEELFIQGKLSERETLHENSSCLINGSIGEAYDIRNYITLFNQVNIILPTGMRYEKFLQSLNLKEEELLKLIESNKVKLIFPHSINHYSKKLLEKATNINPENLMFSRELAYKTIIDMKRRNPISFLPVSTEEKQEILSSLLKLLSSASDSRNLTWIKGLVDVLSNTWSNMHEILSERGALGTFNIGLGPHISTTIKALTGKDYFLEIMEASNSIEWAAANNSILCPIGPLAKNEVNLAYLYSGVRKDWNLEMVTNPNMSTNGILTIARHVPVLELAEAFNGHEIDQFRKLLVDVTHNKNSEEISIAIKQFNENVKRFEKNLKHIDKWDIKGITLDTAMEITNAAIPFSGFITKQLGRAVEHLGDKHKSIEKMVMAVESKIYRASPNVILVSRMRDKIKDLL